MVVHITPPRQIPQSSNVLEPWRRFCLLLTTLIVTLAFTLLPQSHARADVTAGTLGPVMATYPTAYGDTWYNTWANDGDIYSLSDDAHGFNGNCSNALTVNELTGDDPTALTAPYTNCMTSFGGINDTQGNSDGRVWKASGIISVDGVLYVAVERQDENSGINAYPNGYQPSGNTSIIKSTDHGRHWSNSFGVTNDPNGAAPTYNSSTGKWQTMFPGSAFATPIFISYGQDTAPLSTANGGDTYVYAISTNGYVYDNSAVILGRVRRDQIGDLNGSEWQFYMGGDGSNSANWSSNSASAQPVLSSSNHQLSWSEAQYFPQLQRYVMPQFAYPFDSGWFGNGETAKTTWTFYQSTTPWGPWTPFSSADTSPYGWYAPAFAAKFSRVDDLSTVIFTSGDFVHMNYKGDNLYSLHVIPYHLTSDSYAITPDTDSNISYQGGHWTAGTFPDFYNNTIHYSSTAGDSASYTFNGTFIQWVSATNNNHGTANVSIDNGPAVTVDTYSPQIGKQAIIFERTGLASGQHTITITLTGNKNANSTFTYTDVNAFVSGNTQPPVTGVDDADTSGAIQYSPASAWTSGTFPGFFNNTLHYASTAGAMATYTFTGTFVEWIGALNTNHGTANVSIDNGPAVTVDTYSPVLGIQNVNFERTGLSSGQHTLTITVTGDKNANASFTYTDIDAFQSGA